MKPWSWIRVFFSLAIVLTLTVPSTTAAIAEPANSQLPSDEQPPERPHYLDKSNIIPMQSPGESEEAQSDVKPLYWGYGGVVVMTSFRDGAPDLYINSSQSFDPLIRLTNGPAADVMPRLNHGATRIVFISNEHEPSYEIYTIKPDGTDKVRLTSNYCYDLGPVWSPDGSQIAFERDCDGQSDIYVMKADGTDPTRITNHPDYDGQPTWSPDGSKIAFVSHRTGGYRVYSMNVDGTGIKQLSNQAYSADPAWSPDGNMILYDADADQNGWQSLWLMNADGSNQHEIVQPDSANEDVLASGWSPEMTYAVYNEITWVLWNGEWYWEYAYARAHDMVYDDGSIPLDYRGAEWYPDWETLDAQPPATHTTSLPEIVPASFSVSWGLDNPSLADFKNYDIEVKDGFNGTWTVWQKGVTTTTATFTGTGGHTYLFRSRGRDTSNNLEYFTTGYDTYAQVETSPPQVKVDPLPAVSTRSSFLVTWSGIDPGNSGIKAADVQVRDGTAGTGWTNWITNSGLSGAVFSGTPGHTYYFRARGIDRANNQQEYTEAEEGDTSVTIYSLGIEGFVEDNSGSPITDVQVAADPAADQIQSTAGYGVYYQTPPESLSLGFSKDGYGSLPLTNLPGSRPAVLNPVLPPLDNLIANGDFETGDLGTDWTAGGDLAPGVFTDIFGTGQNSVSLGGEPGVFSNAKQISTTYGRTQAALDKQGVLHVLYPVGNMYQPSYSYMEKKGDRWSDPETVMGGTMYVLDDGTVILVRGDEDDGIVNFQIRDPMSGWNTPKEIPGLLYGNISGATSATLDNKEVLHLTSSWRNGDRFLYVQYSRGSGWSSVETVPCGVYLCTAGTLVVGTDQTGTLHSFWGDGQKLLLMHRSALGVWSAIEEVPADNSLLNASDTFFEFSPQGDIYMVWIYQGDIYFRKRSIGGAWGNAELALNLQNAVSFINMSIGPSGKFYIIAEQDPNVPSQALYYISRSLNGTWTTPELVAATTSWIEQSIVEDADGTLYASWVTEIPHTVFVISKPVGGVWGSPEALNSPGFSSDPKGPVLLVGDQGDIHVFWAGNGGQWYAGPRLATAPGDSSIRQTITIPPEMQHPVLSFLARLDGGYTPEENRFTVSVTSGETSTLIYGATAPTTGWKHIWADLSLWVGQTITLEFATHQAAQAPLVKATLDDITVGSAYPDVWVELDGPGYAQPGSSLTFVITYGNHGGAPAPGSTITLTLPEGLSFQSSTTAPSSTNGSQVIWQVGDLTAWHGPQSIQVTLAADQAILNGIGLETNVSIETAGEMETDNNTASRSTVFEMRCYLPAVFRQKPF